MHIYFERKTSNEEDMGKVYAFTSG